MVVIYDRFFWYVISENPSFNRLSLSAQQSRGVIHGGAAEDLGSFLQCRGDSCQTQRGESGFRVCDCRASSPL